MREDRVPEGHTLHVTVASPLPRVVVRPGAWIAELGASSDAAEIELLAIIAELEALLAKPRPRVIVAQGGVEIAQLFAPNNPQVMPLDGLLLWVIDAEALGCTPALVQRLVDQLRGHAIAQTVFVRDAASPRARAVIAAIQSLGIGVRALEPPDWRVLVEVSRPDGVVLSALSGTPLEQAPLAALPGGMHSSVARAPRLRALALASTDASRTALYAELVAREVPLLVIGDDKQGVRRRTWDNGYTALPVHADRSSLLATARELGLAAGSYAIMEMVPRDLFAFAGQHGWAVALNVFDDAGKALYIAIEPPDVRMLAEADQLPSYQR